MNVYFEENGCGGNRDGTMYVLINMYITPTRRGHAFKYGRDGKKYMFAWANPEEAKVFKSNELPKPLWNKFRNGQIDHIEADYELSDYKWTLNDLVIYPDGKSIKEL